MLFDQHIRIDQGRAKSRDFMQITHIPTGISRSEGQPLGTGKEIHENKNKALQALLTGEDLSAEQAEAINVITKYVPKADMEANLDGVIGAVGRLDLRDIIMYRDIISVSIRDEEAGAQLELRYFLERASEDKTQAIIAAFLQSGGQTEREATDFQGVFTDTAAEITN